MRNEYNNMEQSYSFLYGEASLTAPHTYHMGSWESTLASLTLLLGPETDEAIRRRAARRLAKQSLTSLPLVLTILNRYPEITTPAWPHWPPQYEQCSCLLVQLCQQSHHSLESLLQHPVLTHPIGPVLWISAIEATHLLPSHDHEALLREGLATPWATVRYAAAMALVNLAGACQLHDTTLQALYTCTGETEAIPVRLTCAFALMRHNDARGFPALLKLIESNIPEEARKAGFFLLATDPPRHLASLQQERLTQILLSTLQDDNGETALHAAHALRTIALPSNLPSLCSLLEQPQPQLQIAVLTALEELANRPAMRRAILQSPIPSRINGLLRSDIAEVRRQASYTLAACGGPYTAAVLGTTLLNNEHPGHKEATEAIRLLRDALHAHVRTRIVGWLLQSLHHHLETVLADEREQEELQITALDSLAFLAWQAQKRSRKQALIDISREVFRNDLPLRLLSSSSPWVRQRSIELLSLLTLQPESVLYQLFRILHRDKDSGVRACCACTLGQITARSAIPHLLLALLDPDTAVAETALHALCLIATSEDVIVVAALRELTLYGCSTKQKKDRFASFACKQLKQWGYPLHSPT